MPDPPDNSVTHWIAQLKDGDHKAVDELWKRYFSQLVRLCSRKLGNAARRIADEEDVAIDVFESLYRGASEGRFEKLSNREDLWSLLVAISGRKAITQIRHQTSQKRGGTQVRGESVFQVSEDGGFEQILNEDPTPESLVMLKEEYDRQLSRLRDDTHRQIAELRLSGYSSEEIAERTGLSLRSVVRKLGVIREVWSQEPQADTL